MHCSRAYPNKGGMVSKMPHDKNRILFSAHICTHPISNYRPVSKRPCMSVPSVVKTVFRVDSVETKNNEAWEKSHHTGSPLNRINERITTEGHGIARTKNESLHTSLLMLTNRPISKRPCMSVPSVVQTVFRVDSVEMKNNEVWGKSHYTGSPLNRINERITTEGHGITQTKNESLHTSLLMLTNRLISKRPCVSVPSVVKTVFHDILIIKRGA